MFLLALIIGPLVAYLVLSATLKASPRHEIYSWLHKRHRGW